MQYYEKISSASRPRGMYNRKFDTLESEKS